MLGIWKSFLNPWEFFVSILSPVDLILGHWGWFWASGSKFFALVVHLWPLGVICWASVSWCWAWWSLFRVFTIEFEPLRLNLSTFGAHLRPFRVDFWPHGVNFDFEALEVDFVRHFDLWKSILETGNLLKPLRFIFMHWRLITGPLGFDFWPRHVRPYNRVFKIGLIVRTRSDYLLWGLRGHLRP